MVIADTAIQSSPNLHQSPLISLSRSNR
jgi:hypothetical protein